MSNVDAPDVGSGETNSSDLLVEQSGIPAVTKKFTIETDTEILGDLSVISNGAFARIFTAADPDGDADTPDNPKLLSIGGTSLWDAEVEVLNDFIINTGDDIELNAGDDVDISADENIKIEAVDYIDIVSEDNIYLTAEGKIDLESEEYIELNSEVRMIGEVVMVGNLPTIDPLNAGQLWNDNGTLKVSAG